MTPFKTKDPAEIDVQLLIIEGNGPQLIRSIDLVPDNRASSCLKLMSDKDLIVQILGNVQVQTMREPWQDHRLTVRLVSLADGREIWRQHEKIIIRKTN